MRPTLPFLLIVCATALLAACGQQERQADQPKEAEPAAPAEGARAPRPASYGLCMMCHSDVAGKNGLGPSLFGVIGRTSGTLPGYSYSPAMKAANISWDEAAIDRLIQDPRAMVPGTKMSFAGLKDAKKRAEITQYLATLQ